MEGLMTRGSSSPFGPHTNNFNDRITTTTALGHCKYGNRKTREQDGLLGISLEERDSYP